MKTFKFAALALLATVFVAGCGSDDDAAELSAKQEQEIAERIAPAGEVAMVGDEITQGTAVAAGGSSEPRSGQQVYDTRCFTCHAAGVAGAPKIGDVAVWTERLAQGIDTVYSHAINGIRGMPPKGTCMDCSDDEIKAAVDYMLEGSK